MNTTKLTKSISDTAINPQIIPQPQRGTQKRRIQAKIKHSISPTPNRNHLNKPTVLPHTLNTTIWAILFQTQFKSQRLRITLQSVSAIPVTIDTGSVFIFWGNWAQWGPNYRVLEASGNRKLHWNGGEVALTICTSVARRSCKDIYYANLNPILFWFYNFQTPLALV